MVQINDIIKKSIQLFIAKLTDNGIRLSAVYLFGSYAKNKEHVWSDIDIAVVSPDFIKSRLEERIRLTVIANKIDNRIEPVPFRPNTFIIDDPLVWEIKTTGIPILETTQSSFV
ncbi:MAG: nucleotidyltransferase domain-containing protein [Candidatus Desantisbacteria bacterium]